MNIKPVDVDSQIAPSMPDISLNPKDLPSQFKSYPEGCTIKYRPYTFGEVKKINQSTLTKTDRWNFVLEGVTTSFPKDQLALSDAIYIGLLRKMVTLDKNLEVTVQYTCPKCLKPSSKKIKSGDLDFKDLEAKK